MIDKEASAPPIRRQRQTVRRKDIDSEPKGKFRSLKQASKEGSRGLSALSAV
ncbi:hypothetical protein SAMN05428936_103140 [Pelagibacterium halotolerans]|uniref:hypothetical protein n=1 Tax=Pelagibacterium halotolerans TaxID=531813 RepID=UPI0008946620|nr:hypothetical protein [Pelagibacterium halotolerans]SEA35339.1 hypothetical protein SAMN05428936_103140 [Pelagibacterium halotolerans]